MMKWWKKLCRSHKGFTLVELVCAMALFSIVMTSVGSAMVISARSYRNGNVELDLQQQAQIASNLLTNLIIDSDKVVQTSDKTLVVEKVESGVTVTYTIYLDGGELKYFTSVDPTVRTLAANISDFEISRAAGENVDFSLKVESGGRTYESDYHVTPRNGFSSDGIMPLSGSISLFVENRLILEPCQEYDLNVRISGTTATGFSIDTLEGINSPETEITAVGSNIHIKVGRTETDSFHFRVVSDADPSVYQTVEVLIRRVNAINVNGYRTAGTVNKAGAEYKVSAVLAGTNLEREPGAWYDVDYVDPYTAQWTYEFTKEDEFGNITSYPVGDYINIIGQGVEGNVPYVVIKLAQNMTEGCKLRVTSTALHPEGTDPADATHKTNKSGLKYDTVSGYWELEYQAWRRNGQLDIGLELDNSYFWPGTDPKSFMGDAELWIRGYSATGTLVEDHGFNFFRADDSGGYIKVDPVYGDVNRWNMILNTQRNDGEKWAYSSPYYLLNNEDNPGAGGYWKDIVRYEITIWYRLNYGDHAGEEVTLENTYTVEDVQIKYKNSVYSDWNRTNKVYVTLSDSLEKYKIYYMFDKGWENETALYFSDLRHFVGVVHDDGNDYNDVRCDITVSEQGNDGLADYIIFSLPTDKKQECMLKAAGDGGIIREIYEYNPLLETAKNIGIANGGTIPDWAYQGGYPSQADQDRIKGCAGTVEFHFVDPNITGGSLKVMYCPTPDEFTALGNVYYISSDDTEIRMVRSIDALGNSNVVYQETSGGAVTTKYLSWNGAGWTIN